YFIVIICLFIPSKSYEVYHAVLILVLLVDLVLQNKITFNYYVVLILGIISFLLFVALLLSFYFESYAIRDFVEVIRFFPLLLLSVIRPTYNQDVLNRIFLVYLFIDLVVSISQFLMLDLLPFLTNLYGSSYHVDTSLLLNNRATGLSSGPGQHGTIMSFFYVYFLYLYLYSINSSKWIKYGIAMASISLLLSQSQTSFIAISLITIWMIAYTIWNGHKPSRIKCIKLASAISVISIAIFYTFFDQLRYLFSLFTLGLERNSFQRRLDKVDVVHEAFREFPEWILWVFGNDFFGKFARAMDNEYLYIFSIYGTIIGGLMFFFILVFIGVTYFNSNSKFSPHLLIAFLLTVGLI